jgi:hypothetical protein
MNSKPPTDSSTPYGQARRRDRYRYAVAGLTGLAAAGSLTATGWVAGQAAQAWSAQQGVAPAPATTGNPAVAVPRPAAHRTRPRARKPQVVLRARPTQTRVSTRYVRPAAPVGGGGSVGSSSHSSTHSAPAAPSSGS